MKAIAGGLLILFLVITVNRWYGQYKTMSTTNASAGTTTTAPAKGEENPAEETKDAANKDSTQEAPKESDGTPAESAKTVIVLTDGLNFREDPSQDSNVIRGLDKGEKLVLIKKEGSWYQVRDSKKTEGWVSASPNYSKVQ